MRSSQSERRAPGRAERRKRIAVGARNRRSMAANIRESHVFLVYEIREEEIVGQSCCKNLHASSDTLVAGEQEEARLRDEHVLDLPSELADCEAIITRSVAQQFHSRLKEKGISVVITGHRGVKKALTQYLNDNPLA